jgi:hypothetical protein
MKNVHKVFVTMPERKIILGRPRSRCEGNIYVDFRETGRECVKYFHLPQCRDRWYKLVNTAISLRGP